MTTNQAIRVLSSSSLCGTPVKNSAGDDLGSLDEIMLDFHHGRVAYGVLSFGGFLGMGNKLFAIPWSALHVDTDNECIRFDVSPSVLENADGFDKDHWPDMADPRWHQVTHDRWQAPRYWEERPALS